MKHLYKAFYGALLVLGLAGITPGPALAQGGYHWDTVCNCRRPDSEYNTRRYIRESPRVVNHERVVNQTRVVRGNTRLIQENRLVVHVRPVINREVVVHRTNTIVKDVELHRVNTTNKFREEQRSEVVNRYAQGSVQHVLEHREVRGVNCNCGYDRRGFSGDVVSYRD
ncbi:MAG TPA: hypothetical protein VHV56_14155 [Pseudolabrys sp.]|jgi:hypothetical protein|nr:hypothetical protein [Pseudolabrys sp.]